MTSAPSRTTSGASSASPTPSSATSRSPTATRASPRRSPRTPATALTGARSRRGPRGRQGARSGERTSSSTWSSSSASGAGCSIRWRRSGAGWCAAASSSPRRGSDASPLRCTRPSTRSSEPATPWLAATGRCSRRSVSSSRAFSTNARLTRGASRLQSFVDGLRPGDPPEGQRYLRQAFARYERRRLERDPKARAELAVLANLEIGLHEQTRLQPEIRAALDSAYSTPEDLGRRALVAVVPAAAQWWAIIRGPRCGRGRGGSSRTAEREQGRAGGITESFMVLSLPGRVLALGTNLADAYPEALPIRSTPTSARSSLSSSLIRPPPTTVARATGRN